MANSLLTPDMITRAALVVLHQKANFLGNINTAYDSSFAKEGAKIGDSLRIRLPNQYTVSTGPTLAIQDNNELSVTLSVTSQKHIGMAFTTADLTMKVQDFTDRFIDPAVSALVANVEADALSMVEQIYQVVDNSNTSLSLRQVLDARVKLVNALTPMDGRWTALLRPQDNADLVNANKGLFQAATEIASQYKQGKMGTTGGFDFYENTSIPTHTSGTTSVVNNLSITTSLTVSATTPTSSLDTLNNTGPQGTWKAGDVFTLSTVFRAHPETKANTGELQQFVVTADVGATSVQALPFSPPVYLTGPRQNVIATAFTAATIVKVGTPAYIYKPSIFFHPDAFTFATADLVMPDGVDFKGRQVKDGISMRLLRQYDVNYDRVATRLDILYGYKTLRAQLAARVLSN